MLSIIIPTLNEEKYLPRLLKCLREQTFSGFEIIVSDAFSTDKTRKIAKDFGCKITDGGNPAKSRNAGAKIARGNLLLFLDADLYIKKDFLEKTIKEFKKRKLDAASFILVPYSENIFGKTLARIFFDIFYNLTNVLIFEIIYPHGAMGILIKKELHQKINGFDEKTTIAEDHDYVLSASRFGKFRIIRSVRIFFSLRRYKEDGWLQTIIKYLICELHRIFIGPVKSKALGYKEKSRHKPKH